MFPIVLELSKINILLIGRGEALERRHKQLLEYGATNLSICHTSDDRHQKFIDNTIIMVAGLSYEQSKQIADSPVWSTSLIIFARSSSVGLYQISSMAILNSSISNLFDLFMSKALNASMHFYISYLVNISSTFISDNSFKPLHAINI